MKTLTQLYSDHGAALVAEDATHTKLTAAQADYDKLLADFEKQHPDVMQRLDTARENHDVAKTQVQAVDVQVRSLLGEAKFDDLPAGYSQIRKKKVVYTNDTLLKAALQHAPFLLSIDEKKLEKFVFAVCEEVKESASGEKLAQPYFVLPDHYRPWLPSLHVNFDYAPRISKPKVQNAPIVIPSRKSAVTEEKAELPPATDAPLVDALAVSASDTKHSIGKITIANTTTPPTKARDPLEPPPF